MDDKKHAKTALQDSDSQTINVNVWMSEGDDYLFPEMQLAQPPVKTAICFSGGGTRAMTATMGQLRAMEQIGTIKGVGYISCVSGGSWASTIYTYYQSGASNDSELLGSITSPNQYSLNHLKYGLTSNQLAYGASLSFQDNLFSLLEEAYDFSDKENTHRVWIDAVGETFLQPFGLYTRGQQQAIFTLDAASESDIKSRNANSDFVNNATFIQAHDGRPYLVVNSCLLWTYDVFGEYEASFEYTPLAVGDPKLQQFKGLLSDQWAGGGFVENFAYGCRSPADALKGLGKGTYNFNLSEPEQVFGINDATGTSSAAFSADAAQYLTKDLSPEVLYWPVTNQGNTNSETQAAINYFGDGGSLDNMGLVNMVRRGVKSAVVFINTSTVLQEGYDGINWPDKDNPQVDTDFAKLFGYEPQSATYDNQIFTHQDFVKVVGDFQNNMKAGGPIVSYRRLEVQDNNWWGIKNGGQIFVLFVYLGRCRNWENQLPADVAQYMNIGGKGQFEDFPNYKTVGQNWRGFDFKLVQLTSEQITALADLVCWSCQQFLGNPDIKKELQLDWSC